MTRGRPKFGPIEREKKKTKMADYRAYSEGPVVPRHTCEPSSELCALLQHIKMPPKKRKASNKKMIEKREEKRVLADESSDEEVGSDGDKYSYARGTLEDEDEDHVSGPSDDDMPADHSQPRGLVDHHRLMTKKILKNSSLMMKRRFKLASLAFKNGPISNLMVLIRGGSASWWSAATSLYSRRVKAHPR